VIQFEQPSPRDSDEDRYENTAALCDVCGNRPGEIAQDGEWVCSRCQVALELADTDAEPAA
jgi:hypothetical protein